MDADQIIERLWDKLDTIEQKVDDIKSKMVTKSDCKDSQKQCLREKKIEWSNKKLLALGAFGTGILGIIIKLLS